MPPCQHRRHQGGQGLVETALVFPLFLMLLFTCIDIGHYVYVRSTLTANAMDAARQLALPSSASSDCVALLAGIKQDGGIAVSPDTRAVATTATFGPTPAGSVTRGHALLYIFPAVTAAGTPSAPGNCGGAARVFPSVPHVVEVQITAQFQPWTPMVSSMATLTIVAYSSAPAAY